MAAHGSGPESVRIERKRRAGAVDGRRAAKLARMTGPELKRTITLPFLILYGVGTMVGGGFFALENVERNLYGGAYLGFGVILLWAS